MIASADTIFALATPAGLGAIAIIRISGAATGTVLQTLCGAVPPARELRLRRLRDRADETLDHAVVVWMPGPHSYTGQDCAELHLHAGPAVIDGVSDALVTSGLRPAEAGEFSRRAFLNGRIGLTEAEAVADLIAAETGSQRRQALRQLGGALGRLVNGWAIQVRQLLAMAEAGIDFPEETADEHRDDAAITRLAAEIEHQLDAGSAGEQLRRGLVFVIAGAPNVGKSSLFNQLLGREAAIVAAGPGTTRDVIEARTVFGDVPVTLLDTAGLRDSDDPVEAEGVRRARARALQADLVLAVREPGGAVHDVLPGEVERLDIVGKADLVPAGLDIGSALGVSVATGAGVDTLRACLDARASAMTTRAGPPSLTRARHRAACVSAAAHLRAAIAHHAIELRAEELRLAMRALGRITGQVGAEDILDTVFSQFCIGK